MCVGVCVLQAQFGDGVHFNGRLEGSERIPNTCNVSFVGEGLQSTLVWCVCVHVCVCVCVGGVYVCCVWCVCVCMCMYVLKTLMKDKKPQAVHVQTADTSCSDRHSVLMIVRGLPTRSNPITSNSHNSHFRHSSTNGH